MRTPKISVFLNSILIMLAIVAPSASHADARAARKFGIWAGIIETSAGRIGAAWNALENIRLQAGLASGSGGVLAISGSAKILILSSNFSPYLGAEIWHASGSYKSGATYTTSFATGLFGVDHTFDMGLNLGVGGLISTKGGLSGPEAYIGYYF